MTRLRTRPPRSPRPSLESLEDRALAAIGQITLAFPSAPVGLGNFPAIRGTLPDKSIDVLTYSVSSTNPVTVGGSASGAGAGRVKFDPLIVTAAVGPQSAPLFQVEAAGGFFPSARLVVRNDAASQVALYEFGVVHITAISSSGSSGDAVPTETYQFVYGSLRVTNYDPIRNQVVSTASWDQVRNSPNFSITPGFSGTEFAALRADSTPDAGGRPAARAEQAAADAGQVATRVTLRSRRQAGPDGQTITYTARVTSDAGVPPGEVTFYARKTRLGSAPVGPDGTATLTVPAAVVGRARAYAIYSGGPDSAFLPSSSVTNGAQVRRLFRDNMGRSMTADEWTLTSMWINQGLSTKQMGSIYRTLAKRLR